MYKLLLDPVCVHQKSSKREPEREIFDRSMIENLQVFTGQFFPSKNLQAETADLWKQLLYAYRGFMYSNEFMAQQN